MANINDYLTWRGDVKLNNDYPLNEIDNLILARVSYLRFDMVNLDDIETFNSLSNKMKIISNDKFRFDGDKDLIINLGKSRRFKNVKITDYVELNDKKSEKQFSAISIHLPNNVIFISFIGTDNSIFGWKEDFNMAFMEEIPAQIEGLKYTLNILKKYNNKKIILAGHSKGGNIALYVALNLPEHMSNRLIKVYNYDGPGFDKKIVNFNNKENIENKIINYIPQESIIGRLFEHPGKTKVVFSSQRGIMQHDIYSWSVINTKLVKTNIKDSSDFLDKTIKDWLSNCEIEQRKIFVDTLFDLFYSSEVNTFSELSKVWIKKLPKMLESYNKIPKNEKKKTSQMFNNLLITAYNSIREETQNKLSSTKNTKKSIKN